MSKYLSMYRISLGVCLAIYTYKIAIIEQLWVLPKESRQADLLEGGFGESGTSTLIYVKTWTASSSFVAFAWVLMDTLLICFHQVLLPDMSEVWYIP